MATKPMTYQEALMMVATQGFNHSSEITLQMDTEGEHIQAVVGNQVVAEAAFYPAFEPQ